MRTAYCCGAQARFVDLGSDGKILEVDKMLRPWYRFTRHSTPLSWSSVAYCYLFSSSDPVQFMLILLTASKLSAIFGQVIVLGVFQSLL